MTTPPPFAGETAPADTSAAAVPAVQVAAAVAVAPARGSLREVGQLAWPVVLSQLSATAMNVVDSAMVGRLGATELAAVGFAGIWTWTLFCLFHGTASAVQTFVSQDDGAGRAASCGAWAWQGAAFALPAVALCAGLVGLAAPALLALLGPSPALQDAAVAYLRPRLWAEPGIAVAFAWMSFFRGVGDTHTPLRAALLGNLVNAALDYGLVFGAFGLPAWGVAGAGAATAVGAWLQAGFLLAAALRGDPRRRYGTAPVRPRARAVRRLLRVGVPIGGQWMIDMLAFAAFTTLVARMGDAQMAASQAFVILLSMSFMQAVGISVAASTLVGRYVGARDPEAARESFRSSLLFALALAAGIAALFLGAPEALMRIFSSDPAVVAHGVPLVRLGALYQLMDAVAIVASGALRGAGDTRWPFAVQACLAWLVFLPLAWLLGVSLDGGLTAAWSAGVVHIALLSAALQWRFRSGAWRKVRI